MPIRMNGKTYYRTADICHEIGISRATLYRWLRTGFIVKAYKDRRGWRLFTEDDFNKLQLKAMEIRTEYTLARK